MTDPTPAEVAKLDQIHAAVTSKLAELISHAADGITTLGPEAVAADLAGTAYGTDHTSISTLFAAAVVRLAQYEARDRKRAAEAEATDG